MEPMPVVQIFEVFWEAKLPEAAVKVLEMGEDAGEQLLERKRLKMRWQNPVQRRRRRCVCDIDSDACILLTIGKKSDKRKK